MQLNVNEYLAVLLPTLVSTLTRSGNRVQPTLVRPPGRGWSFQPSPGAETGCNTMTDWRSLPGTCFNPHPVTAPGATSPMHQTGWSRTHFNPHPASAPGATLQFHDVLP